MEIWTSETYSYLAFVILDIENRRGGKISGTVGDILIYAGSEISATSTEGAGIGTGAGGTAGNITIYTANSNLNVHSTNGEDIGKGAYYYRESSVGSVVITQDGSELHQASPLVLQTGTKSGQALNVYIDDMRLDALGIKDTKILTQKEASNAIGEMTRENYIGGTKAYDEATTKEKLDPKNYKGIIDRAIDYALDQVTTIGAYINRLEYTAFNLTTAHENVMASESTLRDSDMAKEMVEYTKNNVLLQAAQSMLAQANQNSSSVLGLLQ